MRAWLRRYRLELKYTALTVLVLGGLALVMRLNWLGGLEDWVNATMDRLVTYGYPGLFVIGLLANITLVFMIPYAIPLMTLSMYADSILEVVALGTAAGVGAGIGEITSYAVAHTLVRHVEDLEHSALFRWTKRTISRHPIVIPFFVWLASATPAPDAVIIVPLAMIQYPWRKMIVPMVTGKIFQNVVMALIYRFATDQVAHLLSDDVSFDLTATLVVVFVLLIAYQIEKARAEQAARAAASAEKPPEMPAKEATH